MPEANPSLTAGTNKRYTFPFLSPPKYLAQEPVIVCSFVLNLLTGFFNIASAKDIYPVAYSQVRVWLSG